MRYTESVQGWITLLLENSVSVKQGSLVAVCKKL